MAEVVYEIRVPEGYTELLEALEGALERAAYGKGRERHGDDQPFMDQWIIFGGTKLGIEALLYQVAKKALETPRIKRIYGSEAAVNELRDIIVYAAAAILVEEKKK